MKGKVAGCLATYLVLMVIGVGMELLTARLFMVVAGSLGWHLTFWPAFGLVFLFFIVANLLVSRGRS